MQNNITRAEKTLCYGIKRLFYRKYIYNLKYIICVFVCFSLYDLPIWFVYGLRCTKK